MWAKQQVSCVTRQRCTGPCRWTGRPVETPEPTVWASPSVATRSLPAPEAVLTAEVLAPGESRVFIQSSWNVTSLPLAVTREGEESKELQAGCAEPPAEGVADTALLGHCPGSTPGRSKCVCSQVWPVLVLWVSHCLAEPNKMPRR